MDVHVGANSHAIIPESDNSELRMFTHVVFRSFTNSDQHSVQILLHLYVRSAFRCTFSKLHKMCPKNVSLSTKTVRWVNQKYAMYTISKF